MAIYDTRQRCVYCREYDLPCNEAVHGNPLFPYLSAARNATPPVVPGRGLEAVSPIVYGAPEVTAQAGSLPLEPVDPRIRRARTLATVAVFCIVLASLIAGLSAIAYFAYGNLGGDAPGCGTMCRPVQFTSEPTPGGDG